MTDWTNRLRQRAISTFEHLTAEQTAAGFARLDAEVAANPGQVDVTEGADLLVLRRRDAPSPADAAASGQASALHARRAAATRKFGKWT